MQRLWLLPTLLLGLLSACAPLTAGDGDYSKRLGKGTIWPLHGEIISGFRSSAQPDHRGVDIAANEGTPVVAILPGRVTWAGAPSGWDTSVVVQHESGFSSVYARLRDTRVAAGVEVSKGEVLGRVGPSRYVHFEVLNGILPVDPMRVFASGPPAPREPLEGDRPYTADEPTVWVPEGKIIALSRSDRRPTTPRPETAPEPSIESRPLPSVERESPRAPEPPPSVKREEPRLPEPPPERDEVEDVPSRSGRAGGRIAARSRDVPPPSRGTVEEGAAVDEAAAGSPDPDVVWELGPPFYWTEDERDLTLAILSSIGYIPAKLAFAGVGTIVGIVAHIRDIQIGQEILGAALGGDYRIRPEHIRGDEPIRFIGEYRRESR